MDRRTSIPLTELYKSYWKHAHKQLSTELSDRYLLTWEEVTTAPAYEECAERLALVLEACRRLRHPRLVSGRATRFPAQLGFFNHIHRDDSDTINYLDRWVDSCIPKRVSKAIQAGTWYTSLLRTNELCEERYALAVPYGFNTWSMNNGDGGKVFNFPPQVTAGKEDFGHGGIVSFEELITDPLNRVSAFAYPVPIEGVAPFRCMEHLSNPFYIDMLHLDPPYVSPAFLFRPNDPPDHPGRVRAHGQGRRTNEAKFIAYLHAANVIVGVNEGGAGRNSTLEQRIAFDRLILEFSHQLAQTPRFQLPAGQADRSRVVDYESLTPQPAIEPREESHSGPFIFTFTEEAQLLNLSTAVDDHSTPPGFPNFFATVESTRVTEEIQAHSLGIDDFAAPSETEFEQSRSRNSSWTMIFETTRCTRGYGGLGTTGEFQVVHQVVGRDFEKDWHERVRKYERYREERAPHLKQFGLLPGARTIAQEEIKADERDMGPVGILNFDVGGDTWMKFYTAPGS